MKSPVSDNKLVRKKKFRLKIDTNGGGRIKLHIRLVKNQASDQIEVS